jgi:MT0933-like antitoxin protein
MGLSDKFKQITEKAKESAVEHREQISGAVETAGALADKRTRGRYSDKIAKAASKTEAAMDRFAGQANTEDAPAATPPPAPTPPSAATTPPAATPPPPPAATPPPASGESPPPA